jgi:hypothetical protein
VQSAPPFVRPDPEAQLGVFTTRTTPGPTFPLILASLSVAVLALHIDDVWRYSPEAFWVGVVLAFGLAWAVGRVVARTGGRTRTAAAIALPTLGGALIGMAVQAIVWWNVVDLEPVRDLGGLVDTTEPVSWIASGVVLGGVPGLLVAVFLVLAARALRKLVGHDAAEAFSVEYMGVSGVVGAFTLLVVSGQEAPPLLFVVASAFVSLLVSVLVDGARLRFVRQAFAGADGAFQIVPADRYADDPSLARMVAQSGGERVLLRVDRRPGSYRAAAAQPIALLGDTEQETTSPLRRRRFAAMTMLATMGALAGIAAMAQGIFT